MLKYCLAVFFVFIMEGAFAQKDTLYFSANENSRVAAHSKYSYQPEVASPVRTNLSFWTGKLPRWLHFDKTTHLISGFADKVGQYPVQLYVSNGKDTIHQFFMLTVFDGRTVNILPLGNSITNGTSVYNSYRRELWFLLHQGKYNFDLIGSSTKQWMGKTMPDEDFDMEHEGHSGWTTGNMLYPQDWDSSSGKLQGWLINYTPDLVLLELGTNDVFQCVPVDSAVAHLNTIVGLLRDKNKHVVIFIAQIPPLGKQWAPKMLCGTKLSYAEVLLDLNSRLSFFAKSLYTKISPVILVDQYSRVNSSTDMYDDIHPNKKGEKEMAQRWFRAMMPYLRKIK
jgi:acyl-CoA thioesterase-1